tara:strand:+ start:571 stop:861 length:291 start_codon:yes stop_codon:yes gene_type:complete
MKLKQIMIELSQRLADESDYDDDLINKLEDLLNFIEAVYEIAFGDDAINRDFSQKEVLDRLRTFAYNDLKWTEHVDEENYRYMKQYGYKKYDVDNL